MESLRNRATVRRYLDKEVDSALLETLLETAFRSSNTGNMQLYSVIVSRDAATKQALAPCHFHQPQMAAPVVLTFCADLHRYSQWCLQRKASPGFDNIQSLAYASVDAVIAAQTFCVAAEEAGLGICYLGTTTYTAGQIVDVLRLPPLVFPIATVTLGWPAEKPEPCERLPLEAIVHSETYHDYAPADIDRLFAEKEQLPANRHYVEINGKETLAQVFTDIRYTRRDNELFSEELLKTLRRQGFLK